MNQIQHTIKCHLLESIATQQKALERCLPEMAKAAELLIGTLQRGKKMLVAGNGGSAADAQHFAAELVVKFAKQRKALPGIALTTDTSALTACANDFSFDAIFARQIEALGQEDDIFVGISTSGNSPNILAAVEMARQQRMKVITLLGKDGGKLKGKADVEIIIPSSVTAHIQESHITIIHSWCSLLDEAFP
ncbi:SIS domain-containing protein [Candidatus Woesearchaeota archaeon]|nr:SIS domain-containing protein [Candidatus Woesearchaeota archaeon]